MLLLSYYLCTFSLMVEQTSPKRYVRGSIPLRYA
nr:MAG TPA: hypothetical protein [Caudoviricetes sp.]